MRERERERLKFTHKTKGLISAVYTGTFGKPRKFVKFITFVLELVSIKVETFSLNFGSDKSRAGFTVLISI